MTPADAELRRDTSGSGEGDEPGILEAFTPRVLLVDGPLLEPSCMLRSDMDNGIDDIDDTLILAMADPTTVGVVPSSREIELRRWSRRPGVIGPAGGEVACDPCELCEIERLRCLSERGRCWSADGPSEAEDRVAGGKV